MGAVITAREPSWIEPFTGLSPAQFRKLVRTVAVGDGAEIADGRPGRQWSLELADRVLLVAAYWRTNLTMRQIGPLFGVSHSAAHRVIDSLGPVLGQPAGRHRRRHRRLVIALGQPQPGNRNDCTAYRDSGINRTFASRPVIADGGYQCNREVIMPFRKPGGDRQLPDWKTAMNASHKRVRARVEHALSRLKCWLRDYRRAASTLHDTASGIAYLHNIALGH